MSNDYASRLGGFLPEQLDLETFTAKPQAEGLLNAFSRMVTWFRLLHDIRGQDETFALVAAAHSKVIEIWILGPFGLTSLFLYRPTDRGRYLHKLHVLLLTFSGMDCRV